jgi:regulator of protease activity HflC (stomatin/prohibitin superfamily)
MPTEVRSNFHPIRWLALFILVVVIASTALGSIATVNAGHRGVLLTWGKVEPVVLGEGISFIMPFVNQVVPMSVQTQKYSASASSASKDLQDVSTEVTLNYRIEPTKANWVYQNLGLDYENRIIQPAIQEAVKASTAQFTAEELITQRPAVKAKIESALRDRLLNYEIIMETVSITDFRFSPQFTAAIESKVTAVQQALKAENDLKRIQVEAQQAVATAQGQANATITKAVAEAQAISITGKALRENPQLVQLEWVKKWAGTLPTTLIMSGSGGQQPNLVLLLPQGS